MFFGVSDGIRVITRRSGMVRRIRFIEGKSDFGVWERFRCFHRRGSRRFTGPEGEWSMNVSWVSGMIRSYPRSLGVVICERELKL